MSLAMLLAQKWDRNMETETPKDCYVNGLRVRLCRVGA